MTAEQNALALLDSLSADQRRQLADLCSIVYEAGFDHGNGIGNQLDRLEAGDPRQPLQQIVKAAAAARQELTQQALRWERAAAVRNERYNNLVSRWNEDLPASQVEQPASQVEQPASQVEQPASQGEQPAAQVEQPADPPADPPAQEQWAIIQVSADKRYSIEVWAGKPYTQHAAVQNYVGPYYDHNEALAYIKANGLHFYDHEEDDTEV